MGRASGTHFFVHFMFYVNSRQAILMLYYKVDTSLTWNCRQETFQKSKMTTLKPCSSTSGQFIDIKKAIGNMRIAALDLDIIPLLPWKWFLVKKVFMSVTDTIWTSSDPQIWFLLDPNLQYFKFWQYFIFWTAVKLYHLFQTSFRSNSKLFRAISTVVRAISTLCFDLGLIPHGASDPFIIRSYSKLFLGLIPQYCIS